MWRILGLVERGHVRNQLSRTLAAPNRELLFVSDLESALTQLSTETHHVFVADDTLIGDGLDRLVQAIGINEGDLPALVILTDFRRGHARFGVDGRHRWTLLKKPLNPQVLRTTVEAFLDQIRLPYAIHYLRHKEKYIYSLASIIGASPPMKAVLDLVSKVAASNSAVLITGERGTGKETIAGAIHFNSARKGENFVVVECGALSGNELESELFGHEKGAFDNAPTRRIGRVEQANSGTVYLQEVGSLSLALQAKVLRLIQLGEFERTGGMKTVKVDARIICGTSANLREMVEQGEFREDLFFRINVIPVHLPPLRDRKEDIPALAQFFLHKYGRQQGMRGISFSPKAIEPLMEYDWPGNVRELENVVERALMICNRKQVRSEDILLEPGIARPGALGHWMASDSLNLVDLERSVILEALARTNNVQKAAAKLLGISPRVMHYKIQKHKLSE